MSVAVKFVIQHFNFILQHVDNRNFLYRHYSLHFKTRNFHSQFGQFIWPEMMSNKIFCGEKRKNTSILVTFVGKTSVKLTGFPRKRVSFWLKKNAILGFIDVKFIELVVTSSADILRLSHFNVCYLFKRAVKNNNEIPVETQQDEKSSLHIGVSSGHIFLICALLILCYL